MAEIPSEVMDFLATGPLAQVVTIDPDGLPHVTVAWAGVVDGELKMATFHDLEQKKLRNLRRDPRMVLTFLAKEHSGEGLHPYLVVQGRGTISEGGALAVMDALAEYYIGPAATFPMRDVPDGVVVTIDVDRYYGQGPWAGG